MLTEFAHAVSWIIYFAGVLLGFFVLRHLVVAWRSAFVKVSLQGLYIGVLLAPVATDKEHLFFTPAIMKMAMSALAGDIENAVQALISMLGVSLLALVLTTTYYVLVIRRKRRSV